MRTYRHTLPVIAAIMIFWLSAISTASGYTFEMAEFVCPVGGERFEGPVTASYSVFGQRLDLKSAGSGPDPLPLPVCPSNGFVMFKDQFSQEEIQILEDLVETPEFQEIRASNSDHYVVAILREALGEPAWSTAYNYLQASWEVEFSDPALGQRYLEIALARYTLAESQHTFDSEPWWTVRLLRVELLRRFKRFSLAHNLATEYSPDAIRYGEFREILDQQIALIGRKFYGPMEIGHDPFVLAENGSRGSQLELSSMYFEANGIEQDLVQAYMWADIAAAWWDEQNDTEKRDRIAAQMTPSQIVEAHELAGNWLTARGDIFYDEEDYLTALTWYWTAAAHGAVDAQWKLGFMDEHGLGVRKDNVSAYRWYAVAAGNGDQRAAMARDSVALKMTEQEIDEAQVRARQWLAENPQ